DADVRLQVLVQECSTLPTADNLGAATLLALAEDDQRLAHEALLDAMATERYDDLLRSLEALAAGPEGPSPPRAVTGVKVPPGLLALLAQPAGTGLSSLARRQWRAVRKAVGRLGDEPP